MMFNIFRLLGDFSHLASKIILITTIHRQRSAEGVSLLTQALYTLVFLTRYLDLFFYPPSLNFYNFIFKLTYIFTSIYILFLMFRVFPRSREAEKEWRVSFYILAFATVAAPIVSAFSKWRWLDVFRNFSLVLESVAVLPQLVLLAHTSVPTVINSYYLLALGLYRALYIPNWIMRGLDKSDHYLDPVAIIFGVLQTLLYIEFAWIYWKRQKVMLGREGVVGGNEFARGLVLGRIIGREDDKTGGRRTGGGWRGGGLSVSADDFVVGDGGSEDGADSEDELEREDAAERGLIGGRNDSPVH